MTIFLKQDDRELWALLRTREVWIVDDKLASEKLKIERKVFFLDLRENPRGQFLRVTEDVRGRRDTIIIPTSGLVDFRDALERIMEHVEFDEDEYEVVEVDVEEEFD